MNKIFSIAIMAILAVSAICLVSCGDDDDEVIKGVTDTKALVGTWTCSSAGFEFTGLNSEGYTVVTKPSPCTLKLETSKLTFTREDGKVITLNYAVDGTSSAKNYKLHTYYNNSDVYVYLTLPSVDSNTFEVTVSSMTEGSMVGNYIIGTYSKRQVTEPTIHSQY